MISVSSLRVAVFGISRSGKGYNIGKVTDALSAFGLNFVHYDGIPTVRDYSVPVLGKEFKNTTIEEKGFLMDIFRRKISDREKIPFLIQDEHCCFPTTYGGKPLMNEYTNAKFPFKIENSSDGTREYEVSLREKWIADCDMVFYLCPDPAIVKERMLSSEHPKRNTQITTEDIELWMKFEIGYLKEVCEKNGLYFEILEGNDGVHKKITDRISNVIGIQTPAEPSTNLRSEDYTIIEDNTRTPYAGLMPGHIYMGGGDALGRRADTLDFNISILEDTCRKNGDRFDLDSMSELDHYDFIDLFEIVRNRMNGSEQKKDISALSMINERIIGDSLNSIPLPSQLKDTFKISPMAGVICLGRSVRMLIEGFNLENIGLRYNNYPDLLMKLKDEGCFSSKNYDLLQSLENQRRYYATDIYAEAPSRSMLTKWTELHSSLLAETFGTDTGRSPVLCTAMRSEQKGGEYTWQDHQTTKGLM